jgi:cytochrome bd ubiquinol oxidase subunit I
MEFDPVLLSRIQFAFTVSFHIIFPSFTIGLASYLAVLEGLWLATGRAVFRDLYKFWVKIFAVSFGMGVVSGIVLSYEFGTNWSGLTAAAGNILGPLLGYEVLTAFFLEAGFLGIMLFGWDRVGRGLHFLATALVAIGTLISAFWILAANSWMQTPAGHEIVHGVFYPVDWWRIIFNPSFPYRLMHMVLAAFLTTAFVVGGVGAWYLVKDRFREPARVMLVMAILMIAPVSLLQILVGDLHGLNVLAHQPAKIAAMEGHWETHKGAPMVVFGWPDEKAERNRFEVAIPKLASIILKHDPEAELKGLKEWPPADRPPVAIVFWSFRVMVAIGFAMAAVGLIGAFLLARRQLFDTRWFLQACRLASPLGFVAILAGWFVAEVGRQPYVVYGLLRTAEAVSPVPGGSVAFTLALFALTYAVIFAAGAYYIQRLLDRGPEPTGAPSRPTQTAARPLSYVDDLLDSWERAP